MCIYTIFSIFIHKSVGHYTASISWLLWTSRCLNSKIWMDSFRYILNSSIPQWNGRSMFSLGDMSHNWFPQLLYHFDFPPSVNNCFPPPLLSTTVFVIFLKHSALDEIKSQTNLICIFKFKVHVKALWTL